jgi:Zn-dependent protease with chaperone function
MAKTTREEFAALVQRFEEQAERDPASYRTRVGLFAALGYGFILLLLVVTLGVFGLLVLALVNGTRIGGLGIKLLIVLGIFAFALLRALWVRFDRPEGIPLTRQNAPRVFETVDRMTDALQAPRFHHILLTDDFNAFVAQRPRFGVFGWPVNYLCLGLPLMQALSPEQFEAVLAHELGHQRGGHGRFGGWIYRVNATWAQLLERTENHGTGNFLHSFFEWYAPRFAAYSFALRRADEYEADACAARLTSPRAAADALCLLPVQGKAVSEDYWAPINKAVLQQSVPPATPYTGLMSFLRSGGASHTIPSDTEGATSATALNPERTLAEAMREETGHSDTHPALRDRLRALKQEPRIPPLPQETAAEHFLGESISVFTAELDREWREKIEPFWRVRYEEAQQQKAQLAELNRKFDSGVPLTSEERWKRADWTEDFVGEDAALPLFQELTEDTEYRVGANLSLGRILLQRDDPEGIRYLETARALDQRVALPVLSLLHDYYKRTGDDEKVKAINVEGTQQADMEVDAAVERSTIGNANTRYFSHGLPAETLAKMQNVFAELPDLAHVYIARKEVMLFPERPLFVLAFTLTQEWRRVNAAKDNETIADQLVEGLGPLFPEAGEFLVVPLTNSGIEWFHGPIKRVPESLVYTKAR